jgi:proteasome assembly chaperone (PAC2) family protein
MVPVADDEGGPDMMSFRELARRLVDEHIVKSMSHQRVSQLHREDPEFPPVVTVGRSKAVDWRKARPYFENRKSRQGQRTDLHERAAE